MEHEMIRVQGRKEVPGKPALYGTTKNFLTFFGLLSLRDLPAISEFERG
jgi:segregation and condensation protein B